MKRAVAALILLCLAAPAAARQPVLRFPVDCTPGDSCFVQYHVDRDPGPGAADFTCGRLSYDGHDGTDIALPSLAAMAAGVDVLAAAPGRVLRIRDALPDIPVGGDGAPDLDGRDCGNGVVIGHGGGWASQYCHMRQGSVAVQPGQRVGAGTVLGRIGLSGRTEFPHLHFALRHDGARIDPYHPADPVLCDAAPDPGAEPTLWQDDIAYTPTGLIAIGFADAVPAYDAIKAGTAGAGVLTADAPGLVLWGYAFGSRPGDALHFRLDGPQGTIVDRTETLDRTQAQYFRALGKRRPPGGWPAGNYDGTVTLMRDGAAVASRTASLSVAE